jgi:hypothetical protein
VRSLAAGREADDLLCVTPLGIDCTPPHSREHWHGPPSRTAVAC